MSKNTAFWVMLAGALASGYDLYTTPAGGTAGDLYGAGKPLENMRLKVYTRPASTVAPITAAKDYYLSVTDAAALVGAYFYFR